MVAGWQRPSGRAAAGASRERWQQGRNIRQRERTGTGIQDAWQRYDRQLQAREETSLFLLFHRADYTDTDKSLHRMVILCYHKQINAKIRVLRRHRMQHNTFIQDTEKTCYVDAPLVHERSNK